MPFPPNDQRGSTLVQRVVTHLRATRQGADVEPIEEALLAQLTLDGKPLPAALRTWLAYDNRWPEYDRVVEDGTIATLSMEEALEELIVSESEGEDWEEDTRAAMQELAAQYPGRCIIVRDPCQQDKILYLGVENSIGEHPVLCIEDESIWVGYPGLDIYLAEQADWDVGGSASAEYRAGVAEFDALLSCDRGD